MRFSHIPCHPIFLLLPTLQKNQPLSCTLLLPHPNNPLNNCFSWKRLHISTVNEFMFASCWPLLIHLCQTFFKEHFRDVPWENIFKLSAYATASEFCEWVQVGIDVYIPHRKYQIKPHSSPWFSLVLLLP